MSLVKSWKEKQKSFITVIGDLKKERQTFLENRVKQLAIDKEDALNTAAPLLDKLNINKTVFDAMVEKNEKNVVKVYSWELETNYIIDLGSNSITDLGRKSSDVMNNYTVEDYGDELYFREFSSTETDQDHFTVNTKRGTYERFDTRKSVSRIRNRISAGLRHLLILMPNGKLYSTGSPENGNLGRIHSTNDSRLIYNAPVEVLDGLDIFQIESNQYTSLVLTNIGIYAFGLNNRSQLANGGTKTQYVPIFVNGFRGAKIEQIALGYQSAYAIDESGKLWGWGSNDQGQLGDRTWDDKNRPFSVYRFASLANQTIVRVCAGYKHALVLSNTNRLFSMGNNDYGQLGINSVVAYGEPIQVLTKGIINETISDIQCGYGHNLVLTESGRVYAWGYNLYGQLGDNSTTNKLIPKMMSQFGPGSNTTCIATKIQTKSHHNFVYCKDGSLYSWGKSDVGQTGTGTLNANVLVPTKIIYSLQPIVDITSNEDNSFLFLADGSVHAVGYCNNIEYFAGSSCYDTKPYHWTGTSVSRTYSLSPSGKFVRMNNHVTMTLPWHKRKMTYFDLGEVGYLLKADDTTPTIVNNGFSMYTKNLSRNDNVWTMVEYNKTINEGFPTSIHNSHFFKHNEEMYLFGGILNNNVSNAIFKCPIYDLKKWEKTTFTLPIPVASGMIIQMDDYVYIFGGISQIYSYQPIDSDIEDPSNKPSFVPIILDTIMRAPLSNITNFEIVNGSVIPTPLFSSFIEIIDDHVYLFGGSKTFDSSSFNIFRANLNDPLKWEMTFGLLPYYMSSTGIISSLGNLMYIYGGSNSTYGTTGPYFAIAEKSDPVGSWMAVYENSTRTADWCQKNPFFCIYCNGIQASSQSVCSSKGICTDYDTCQCEYGRFGSDCELVGIVSINGVRRYADGSIPKTCADYKNPTNSSRTYQGMTGRGLYLLQASLSIPPIIMFCEHDSNSFTRHDLYTVQLSTSWNTNYSNSIPFRSYKNLYWNQEYVSKNNVTVWSTDSVENYCRTYDTSVPNGKYYCFSSPNLGVTCTYGSLCVDGKCFCGPERYGSTCSQVGIIGCDGARRYADFTYARNCYEYKFPTNISRIYNGSMGDGVYIIQPDPSVSPIRVYCDMTTDGGGYTLLSKFSTGQFYNPADSWTAKANIAGTLDKYTTDTVLHGVLFDYWSMFSYVRLEINKNSAVQRYFSFYSRTYNDWFLWTNCYSSSYSLGAYFVDWTTKAESIPSRQFIIEYSYGGCGSDRGWLMLNVNGDSEGCNGVWTRYAGTGLSIRYSGTGAYTYWTDGTNSLFADTMTIMAK